MLNYAQYLMLKWFADFPTTDTATVEGESKLEHHFGSSLLEEIRGKTVIDFGCGEGYESVAMAEGGANVIGLDIRKDVLKKAENRARTRGVENRCHFATEAPCSADVVITIDAFEHFDDPGAMLGLMASLLKPNGYVLASFGPTWLHPLGGHGFSVFPWSHVLFSERALIRWRSDYKDDGATRFSEVAGGLNKMTIRRFEKLVEQSPLYVQSLVTVPIRRLRSIHNRLTREWFTSVVRCRLSKR